VAVGGDGTFNEMVNGMLARKDKKHLPVAFIPNGKANDICSIFSIDSIDRALDYIIKGQTIRMDLMKVLIDYNHENEIPPDKIFTHLKYAILQTSFVEGSKLL
jgi:diacylglycerol kinase family enzyme